MANQTSIAARKIRPDGDVGISRTNAPAARVRVLQPAFVPPSNGHSAPLRHTPTTEVSSSLADAKQEKPASRVTIGSGEHPPAHGIDARGERTDGDGECPAVLGHR